MKKIFARRFIKADDLVLLCKVSKRQAQSILKKIRTRYDKQPGQLVTYAECTEYLSIPETVVEEAVL